MKIKTKQLVVRSLFVVSGDKSQRSVRTVTSTSTLRQPRGVQASLVVAVVGLRHLRIALHSACIASTPQKQIICKALTQ